MFTGIIEATAEVLARDDHSIIIARPRGFDDLKLGSSIAISGVCLTVVKMDEASLIFDVVPETFAKSAMGKLKKGDCVNLERAMRADGRFDGHVVQGHIEGVGEVTKIDAQTSGLMLSLRVPSALLPFIIPKGSITLDGVSLTVASVDKDIVTVALIPETLKRTTFGDRKPGDQVNIETDIFMRALLHRQGKK